MNAWHAAKSFSADRGYLRISMPYEFAEKHILRVLCLHLRRKWNKLKMRTVKGHGTFVPRDGCRPKRFSQSREFAGHCFPEVEQQRQPACKPSGVIAFLKLVADLKAWTDFVNKLVRSRKRRLKYSRFFSSPMEAS